MYARKRNYIIYASTCTVCSSVEYVYENLFENEKELNGKHKMKRKPQNEKELNGKHKMKR